MGSFTWMTPPVSKYYAMQDAFRINILEKTGDYTWGIPIPLRDIVAINFNRVANGPLSWSMVLRNLRCTYAPYWADGPFYQKLTPDIFSASNKIKRVFQFTYTYPNETYWESPHLVLNDTNWDPGTGYVNLSGTDASELLSIENQSMTSWQSTPSLIVYAKTIIEAILTAYGINSCDLTGFTDFPVKLFHFTNARPLDMILQLLDLKGAHWMFKENNKFYAYTPNYKSAGPPVWTLKHGEKLLALTYKQSRGNIYNQVTICRTKSSGNIIASTEGKEYGEHTMAFDPALNVMFVFEPLVACMLDTQQNPVAWRDGEGLYHTNPGDCNGAVYGVKWNVGVTPTYPQGSENVYWKARVLGEWSQAIPEEFGPFEDFGNVVVKDSSLIAKYGLRQAPDVPDNPLIWNEQAATDYGRRIIEDSCRTLEMIEGAIPFNPWFEPGQTIKVVCGDLYMDHFFFTEGVNMSIDFNSGTITNTFSATKYQHTDVNVPVPRI